ncbi:MAG: hypothetical protein LN414_04025 [Candidatus Thermoplasmatota archaeon]|nr:hypothetical protein [Candidatus Thermoplasmatota archaeon]
MFIMMVLIAPGVAAVLPSVPSGDPSVGISEFHQIIMMQGDDPDTLEEEDRLQLTVVERTMWRVPYDSNTVYTYIPPMARNVLMDNVESFSHQGENFFIPGPFSFANNPGNLPEVGIIPDGLYGGFQFWKFPIGADRDTMYPLDFNTTEDFDDADPNLTEMDDWDTSDGNLTLSGDQNSSTYVSKRYVGGVGLVSVNMTMAGENEENVTIEISADDGTTWKTAENGSPLPFDNEGNEFRWRVNMTQNLSDNATPVLYYAYFDILFTPENTSLWIETSYVINIPVGGLTFDMVFPFDANQSGMIFLGHFDIDMSLELTGTEITEDVDAEYMGKTRYTHMTGGYSSQLILEVEDLVIADDNEGLDSWLLIAIPIALIFVVIVVFMMVRGEPNEKSVSDGTSSPDEEVNDGEGGRSDIEDLEERKTELVNEIRDLDSALEEGLISEKDHRVQRAELKAEALSLMRQIKK